MEGLQDIISTTVHSVALNYGGFYRGNTKRLGKKSEIYKKLLNFPTPRTWL